VPDVSRAFSAGLWDFAKPRALPQAGSECAPLALSTHYRAAMCRRGDRNAPFLPMHGKRTHFFREPVENYAIRVGRIAQRNVRIRNLTNAFGFIWQ
jgi:hypothetical protein